MFTVNMIKTTLVGFLCGFMVKNCICSEFKTDCKNGGETSGRENCSWTYKTYLISRDEAMKSCSLTETSVIMPPSNHPDQLFLYKMYVVKSEHPICEEIWTGMHYDHEDRQVHFLDGSILGQEYFKWLSGSPPNTSAPCLAAKSNLSEESLNLLPKDCETALNFVCIFVKDGCNCSEDETCFATFDDSCSSRCEPTPTPATTSFNETTTTEPTSITPDSTTSSETPKTGIESTTLDPTTNSGTVSKSMTTTAETTATSGSHAKAEFTAAKVFVISIFIWRLVG